jgi:cytochrome c peroxidase
VEQVFEEEWWKGDFGTDAEGTQMKENFTLFFGLAMQLYQGTLVADDTPFDQFMGALADVRGDGTFIPPNLGALTAQEKLGLDIFQGSNFSGLNADDAGLPLINAGCNNCHFLPESSNHVVRLAGLAPPVGVANDPLNPVNVLVPRTVMELMVMGDQGPGVYDIGFYNIAVRPTDEDIGRAGTSPATTDFPDGLPLSVTELAYMKWQNQLPDDVAQFVPDQGIREVIQPDGTIVDVQVPLEELFAQAGNRIVTQGAFKVPTLRNQEFQGPYFHTGGDATLRQVVEFYARGGNFPATNIEHLDADMGAIPELDVGNPDLDLAAQAEDNIQALVAFLSRGLTDLRVAQRQAPFDHPQLFIPEGITGRDARLVDGENFGEKFKEIKATGAGGAGTIPRFLGLNPQDPIQYEIDLLN